MSSGDFWSSEIKKIQDKMERCKTLMEISKDLICKKCNKGIVDGCYVNHKTGYHYKCTPTEKN